MNDAVRGERPYAYADAHYADELGERAPEFLRLALLASAAHDQFVFRDPTVTVRFYEELYRRGGADFAPPAGRLLLWRDRPVGMFALVTPDLLRRRRLVGALMVARSEQVRADSALGDRLRLAARTFVRPLDGDGYLSRLAVDVSTSAQGVGRRLLADALAASRSAGLRRCVLEVADTNSRALELYRRAGFEPLGSSAVSDPETGTRLGYIHMAASTTN